MPAENWLDRAIGFVAPQHGLRRVEARSRMARMTQSRALYEAAGLSRRTQGWRAAATDANAEIRGASMRLRDVARDMVRNNAYAARAVNAIEHNVVGTGILPQARAARPERMTQVQDLLNAHYDGTTIDADGRLNLYGLQGLAMRTIAESGSVIIRRRTRRPTDPFAIPLQLQVLEPDFLDTTVEGPLPNGNYAVQGVEFGLLGQRVAYYLYDQHPGSAVVGQAAAIRGTRVLAENVAHVFRVDRPGQVTGITWFAPVILRMRDFADYCDAQLIRQKIAACFAAFITTADAYDEIQTPVVNGAPVMSTTYPAEVFEPGMIERLREGESVSFATPPTTSDFGGYSSTTLHEIAIGLDIPYEVLTGDLREVSFISGRLGRIEFRSSIEAWRWNMLIPQMLDPVARWTREAVFVVTGSTEDFWLTWTPPKYEMVDPGNEVPAMQSAVRGGFSSRSELIRTLGFDPAEVDAEIAADNERADSLGLVFDSDPRRVTTRGVSQKDADPNAPEPADSR